MKKLIIILSFAIPACLALYAQPDIPLDFTFNYYYENFTNKKEYWVNSEDSLILLEIKNNRIKIENKKNENDYVKFYPKKNHNTIYQINSEFTLLPALNISNSAGLLFNYGENDTSFLVIELNGKEQYRIRKKYKQSDSYYTAGMSNNGWVQHPAIHKTSEKNKITLYVFIRKYYLYINDQFIQKFEDMEIHRPRFGLITSPLSTALFYNLSILLPHEVIISDKEDEPDNPGLSVSSSKTDSDNPVDYKMTEQDEDLVKKILELGSKIYLLQSSINKSLDMIDSLKQENKRLASLNSAENINDNVSNISKENYNRQQIEILNEQLNLATEMIQRFLGLKINTE